MLSKYIEKAQDKVIEEHGGFFAFSNDQFKEQRKVGVSYTHYGAGLYCPVDKLESLKEGLATATEEGRKARITDIGIEQIIDEELNAKEVFVSYDFSIVNVILGAYGVTPEEVEGRFYTLLEKHQT